MSHSFIDILHSFHDREIALHKVEERLTHFLGEELAANLIDQLKKQLVPIVINVLHSEYEGYKEHFHLAPDVALKKFNDEVKSSPYFFSLKQNFPLMERKIRTTINHFLLFMEEIKNNLNLHKRKNHFDHIDNMEVSLGDTHNKGRTVCFVELDGEKYIYKPRNSSIDVKFMNFISQYIPEYKYKIFNYQHFSLHEVIEYKPHHHSLESVRNYFYNIGFISASFYFLCSTDMHFENLIVNGEVPVFIDLETISDITDFEKNNTHNDLYNLMSNSIFQSMVYPFEMSENYLNISALTGEKGTVSKFHYTNSKTMINSEGELEIAEENPFLEEQKNNIYLNGTKQTPSMYTGDIKRGFLHFCRIVLQEPEKMYDQLLSIIKDSQIRQVIRPTHIYAKYLNISLEAYYLKELERDTQLFSNLGKSKAPAIIQKEMESLCDGDIPLFYTYHNSYDLYSEGEIIAENYFSTSIEENIKGRILNFNSNRLLQELNNIESSLLIYNYNYCNDASISRESVFLGENDPLKFLEEFNNIFQTLNDSTSALLPTFSGSKMTLSPITPSIFEYGGNLLLLLFCKDELNIETERFIQIFNTMKNWKTYSREEVTGFNGVSASLYLHLNAYKLTGESYFLRELLKELNEIPIDNEAAIKSLDYFTGLSGMITVLSEINLNITNQDINDRVDDILNSFVKTLKKRHNELLDSDSRIGLSHGYSGLILALSRYDRMRGSDAHKMLINQFITMEENYYDEGYINYTDLRDMSCSKYYICYGIVGILLARIELLDNGYSELRGDIAKKSSLLYQALLNDQINLRGESYCLCHGVGGLLELLEELKRLNLVDLTIYEKALDKLLFMLGENRVNGVNNFLKYSSFMLGSGGKAYNKLRSTSDMASILRLKVLKTCTESFDADHSRQLTQQY
ncbi:type 2 lanthipeptide synthetase LanM [Bacillus massilinigeriensis]|uniref:type 2 lanthipeptide synthetase LanM n=1 Tax=Bacillus mediterraneensis TaxID=1805474 RepID=UPI0008F90AD7|nr:type 2 lanthipeptide synthetase LanM [Bacillus mediterraneensis]